MSDLFNEKLNKNFQNENLNIFTISNEYPLIETLILGIKKNYRRKKFKKLKVLLPNLHSVLSFKNQLKSSINTNSFETEVLSYGYVDEKEYKFKAKNLELNQAYIGDVLKKEYFPTISDLEKKIILTKFALRWGENDPKNRPKNFNVISQLVEEVCLIFESLQIVQESVEKFSDYLLPEYMLENKKIVEFISIIANSWPEILKERGLIDSIQRHNILVDDYFADIVLHEQEAEIVAVGLPDNIKSEEIFLKKIANLSNAKVVFPGLDIFSDEKEWKNLTANHPQYAFKKILCNMGVCRTKVKEWSKEKNNKYSSRVTLIRESMKQLELTQEWKNFELQTDMGKDFHILHLENVNIEAEVIATIIREEIKMNKTVSLISLQDDLIRRVVVNLKGAGICLNGTLFNDLKNTNFAIFFRLIGEMIRSSFEPVSLLAVLKHPLSSGGQSLEEFKKNVFNLEKYFIRGSLITGGIEDYINILEQKKENVNSTVDFSVDDLIFWFEKFIKKITIFLEVISKSKENFSLILMEHLRFSSWLASDNNTYKEKDILCENIDPCTKNFFEKLLEYSNILGVVNSANYFYVIEYLLENNYQINEKNLHNQIHILRPSEAQFYKSDINILGGLNEGSWPEKQNLKLWLSQQAQKKIGINSNEEIIGNSAYNFCQLISCSEVILTRSEKKDGLSTIPSRWLDRIEALIQQPKNKVFITLLDLNAQYNIKTSRIKVVPCNPPEFSPPIESRPCVFSISDIQHLVNNPYKILVEKIMGIESLPELKSNLDNKDWGIYAHDVLQKFTEEYNYKIPKDAFNKFVAINNMAIKKLSNDPIIRTFWLYHFEKIGEWFIRVQSKKEKSDDIIAAETFGKFEINLFEKKYTITAKADRIDKNSDGNLSIIDYKTGSIPSWKSVEIGEFPQLPLEVLIAESGGFSNVPAQKVDEISYWKLSGVSENTIISNSKVEELIKTTLKGLVKLLEVFNNSSTAYLFNPWSLNGKFDEYDHLSRHQEWKIHLKEKDL